MSVKDEVESLKAERKLLKAKRERLEADLLVKGRTEALELAIPQQIVCIGNEIVAISNEIVVLYGLLAPVANPSAPAHLTQANLHSVNDQIVVGYRQAFREGLTIMGQVNQPSDKLSQCSHTWAKIVQKWDFPCVVCGWKFGVAATYPEEAARIHKVSAAHILSSEKDCKRLGVDFDQTNFLPLCGAKDEVPSCHSAFDRRLLCFVKCAGEDHDRWTIMASDSLYRQFNMKEIDLQQFKPHRRCLHSHALHCIQNNQVIPRLPPVNLDTTPPDAEDDPAPEVEWNE